MISEFALILARTAVAQWLFYFAVLQSTVVKASLNGFALFGFFALSHIVLRLMIKQDVNLAVFVTGVIVFAVCMGFLAKYLIRIEPFDPDVNITVHVLLVAVSLVNGGMAYKNNPSESVLGKFDLLLILVTILLFATQLNKSIVVSDALTWCLAAMAFIVAASAYSRASEGKVAGRGGETAGKIGVAVLLAAVCAISGAVISKVQNGSRRFAEVVVEGIKAVYFACARAIAFVCSMIYRFFVWLSSFGTKETDDALPPPGNEMNIPQASGEEIDTVAPLWFKILLGVIAAAILFLILRKLSKMRFERTGPAVSEKVMRENMFGAKLNALWTALCDKIAYAVFCISKRNTVPGLLAYCEKKAGGRLKRKPSESGEKFLRRLAEAASSDDKATLLKLASLCERHYYSAEKQNAGKELCTAVRKLSFAKF